MLVPDFGPTMNVIAYWPFQDGVGGGSWRKRQGDRERRGAQTDETAKTVWGHGTRVRCQQPWMYTSAPIR